MTLIVAGVTGATLLVTQRRVQATYEKLLEERFQTEKRFFWEKRMLVLAAIAKRCEEIAKSVRVIAALEEGSDHGRVYMDIMALLPEYFRPVDRPGVPPAAVPAAAPKGRPRPGTDPAEQSGLADAVRKRAASLAASPKLPDLPIVRVVDANGDFIEAADPRLGIFKKARQVKSPAAGAKRLEQIRDLLDLNKPLSEALTDQEIGYVEFNVTDKETQLHQIIVTPIRDEVSDKLLGALLIAFRVGDFGEKEMSDFTNRELLSGIWLNGRIFSKTIPPSVVGEVGASVGMRLVGKEEAAVGKPVMVNSVPHRLFFELLNPGSPFPPVAQVCLYSMKDSLAEQAELRERLVGFGLFAVLAGIGVILFISRGLSIPIEELALATQRIREGDFTVNVPVRSRDEVGALTASFNEMSVELALKERYKTVLAQVTDKQVAEQLISGRMTLGGEVRRVSVLFCDIRGFTALTEAMPPAEVITMLNEHMSAMNRVVHRHHGVVDKFVGDLIMAVFGAPKSYGNDARQAVNCALEMIAERRRLNSVSRHSFEIGIGVATGEVVAGCMGSDDRLNYTVLGERVNLASRLCSKAGAAELLIDGSTFEELPADSIAEPTEPLTLKGFSAPIPAYRVTELPESVKEPVPAPA